STPSLAIRRSSLVLIFINIFPGPNRSSRCDRFAHAWGRIPRPARWRAQSGGGPAVVGMEHSMPVFLERLDDEVDDFGVFVGHENAPATLGVGGGLGERAD